MTCREVIEFLAEYRAGELSPEQQRDFTEHLDVCPKCVAYIKGYDEAVGLGKAALSEFEKAASYDVPEELVQAILAAQRKRT